MKRFGLTLSVLLALLLVVGCVADPTDSAAPDSGAGAADAGDAPATPSLEGLDAIAFSGPGEAAALAALPALLPEVRQRVEAGGGAWVDVSAAEPRLVAYLVRVDMTDQVTLAEVRADGRAHSLYAYYRAFDSGSLIWIAASEAPGAAQSPRSPGEQVAVDAVRAAMVDAFPDDTFDVNVYGYRFVYVAADTPLLSVEVAVDGTLISATADVK
jgi:hypothetical protein